MHILLLVPYYNPDLGPSAPLFAMLGKELAQLGHQVTVIAAVPHYPSGLVPAAFQKQWIQRSVENEVEVIRIRVPSVKRANVSQRLLQYICYQLGAACVGISLKYDAVFVANPALWVWLPFTLLVVFKRKPSIFSVHDVYPDVGVTLGIFRNKLVIEAVRRLERFCLRYAKFVRILSESFRPSMNNLDVSDAKIALIYDWVDIDLIKPLPKINSFTQEYHLDGKFIILYAGNIGLSQGLEYVLTAAKQLSVCDDLLFVFVGDGSGREKLVSQAEQDGMSNVIFLPFQPRERLPEVLASADISLITLKRGIGTGSLPSKTLSGLASGRPLVVSVDENSDTWDLVKQADAGICVPPENPSLLAEAILTLMQDPDLCKRMGKNGRMWAEQNHSPLSAAIKIEQLLKAAIP